MSKHTPGPWVLFEPPDVHSHWDIGPSCSHLVASTFAPSFISRGARDQDECDANACLIAAAPDLLAAAEWALTALPEPIHGNDSSYGREHEQLRAAIAAAKGEV